jgi:hypothetical protein
MKARLVVARLVAVGRKETQDPKGMLCVMVKLPENSRSSFEKK